MKSKIMVVDDEMHIRELVRFYLDKAGFDTIEAANAEEALDIVENQYIDLAVVGGDFARFALDVDEETSTLLEYDIVDMSREMQDELRQSIMREGKILYEKV